MNEKTVVDARNFCRIFEMPEHYPHEHCFYGGVDVMIKMVDWFYPIPEEDFEVYCRGDKDWSYYRESLLNFVKRKSYMTPGKTYLLLTDFGESEVFTLEKVG